MNNNISEIDDPNFFYAKDGQTDPKSELLATIDSFYITHKKDDNSSICRFPARYSWIKEQLDAKDFPNANCKKYNKLYKRVDPKSITLVFPSAHINSPASMFGHTFLRINSSFNSKLLSYAINYAANANSDTENGVVFALKGLFGGYYGLYSLLPYYEKLKEYRDSEQRDIWEYDLNFTPVETEKMFQHIWELNGINSDYYFFTKNCSYSMLWLLEVARPSIDLRKNFTYQVLPLETVHIAQEKNLIVKKTYRPSKRTKLLLYEKLIQEELLSLPISLVESKTNIEIFMKNEEISLEQKRYILEASVEYLEYQFSKGKIKKEQYLKLFHTFTKSRATLGERKKIEIPTPPNPLHSHRAAKVTFGVGNKEGKLVSYLGIRPAYHDLEDSNYGFLRGTQIEFLDLLISTSKEESKIEKATILSIVSLTQRSEFFKSFSWRAKIGWDNDSLFTEPSFSTKIGAGYSIGNESAFIYFLTDALFYTKDKFVAGIGGSFGISVDKYDFMNTNIELTKRFYDNAKNQTLIKVSQGFKTSQNTQIAVKYDYKDKYINDSLENEQTFSLLFKYYF